MALVNLSYRWALIGSKLTKGKRAICKHLFLFRSKSRNIFLCTKYVSATLRSI